MVSEKHARKTKRTPRRESAVSIWDTPRIRAMCAEPLGSPIDVTPEEAKALATAAFGRGRGRWPDGAEYVKGLKHLWKGFLKPRNG